MVLAAFFACLHTGDTRHAMGIAGLFSHFAEGNKGNTMVLVTFFLFLQIEMCLNTFVLQAFSCICIGGHRKYNGIGRLFCMLAYGRHRTCNGYCWLLLAFCRRKQSKYNGIDNFYLVSAYGNVLKNLVLQTFPCICKGGHRKYNGIGLLFCMLAYRIHRRCNGYCWPLLAFFNILAFGQKVV